MHVQLCVHAYTPYTPTHTFKSGGYFLTAHQVLTEDQIPWTQRAQQGAGAQSGVLTLQVQATHEKHLEGSHHTEIKNRRGDREAKYLGL